MQAENAFKSLGQFAAALLLAIVIVPVFAQTTCTARFRITRARVAPRFKRMYRIWSALPV